MTGARVLLGHGTENDFVLLPDPDGDRWPDERLDAALVRRLCDRRAGLGADGVLRLVRSLHVPDAGAVLGADLDRCEWFMDHRNADGSTAEMCGNGIRLFLHALLAEGLVDPATADAGLDVGTRGGLRRVGRAAPGSYWVDMGPARPFGQGTAELRGVSFTGAAVSMGNPHLVALVDTPVDDLDLDGVPEVDARLFPDGVNLEVVNVLAAALEGASAHARLRVVERGVGETRSCGTGACAVAHATLAAGGRDTGSVVVDVPGGRLVVQVSPATTVLTGPAVLVAAGTLTGEWLAG